MRKRARKKGRRSDGTGGSNRYASLIREGSRPTRGPLCPGCPSGDPTFFPSWAQPVRRGDARLQLVGRRGPRGPTRRRWWECDRESAWPVVDTYGGTADPGGAVDPYAGTAPIVAPEPAFDPSIAPAFTIPVPPPDFTMAGPTPLFDPYTPPAFTMPEPMAPPSFDPGFSPGFDGGGGFGGGWG